MTDMQRRAFEDWLDPDGKVTCKRPACGYRWIPKGDHKPACCPKCRRYLDKPVIPTTTTENKPGGI